MWQWCYQCNLTWAWYPEVGSQRGEESEVLETGDIIFHQHNHILEFGLEVTNIDDLWVMTSYIVSEFYKSSRHTRFEQMVHTIEVDWLRLLGLVQKMTKVKFWGLLLTSKCLSYITDLRSGHLVLRLVTTCQWEDKVYQQLVLIDGVVTSLLSPGCHKVVSLCTVTQHYSSCVIPCVAIYIRWPILPKPGSLQWLT
jgi:hypothetical protein